jgi:hypothetical protein
MTRSALTALAPSWSFLRCHSTHVGCPPRQISGVLEQFVGVELATIREQLQNGHDDTGLGVPRDQ